MTTRTVRVDLGTRAYDIRIGPGLLSAAGAEIAARCLGSRVAIVTDETVAALHLGALQHALTAAGMEAEAVVLASGERTKSFEALVPLLDRLLAMRLERSDIVLALGGGVVGDLAGFASGILKRGTRFVQVPTTLLAQVDSSVGGKTGINTSAGKNLVGVFHQPDLVLADTDVLDTLPAREFAAGYAEVVKYGLIDRPDFFGWLEANRDAVFASGEARIEAIAECCRAKAETVVADEREEGRRALLNLGHTFGHALEAAAGYDAARLVHGEGVAIGMALAHRFSARLGLCAEAEADCVARHLEAAGLPTRIDAIPGSLPTAESLMAAIAQDKKVSRGRLTFILTRGIGSAFVEKGVDPSAVEAFLIDELSL